MDGWMNVSARSYAWSSMRIQLTWFIQRMKAEGKDVLNPDFSGTPSTSTVLRSPEPPVDVRMTRTDINRTITAEELKAQDKDKPWVRGMILWHAKLTIL